MHRSNRPNRPNRLVALLLIAGALAATYGCSSAPEEEESPKELNARLESETGVGWAMRVDEHSKEVRFLAPEKPVHIGDGSPEQMARGFFDRYRKGLHGTGKADELRLVLGKGSNDADVDVDGTTHIRFEHYLPGTNIPVLGVASTAHFTSRGEVYYLQPGFRADLESVPKTATISEDDAVKRAVAEGSAKCGAAAESFTTGGAQLSVRADERLPSLLVWRVPMKPGAGGSCTAPQALVDATTGEIVSFREMGSSLWDTAKGTHAHHTGEVTDNKVIDVTQDGSKYVLKSPLFSKIITRNYTTGARGEVRPPVDITTTTLGTWTSSSSVKGAEVDAHFFGYHALRFWKEGLTSLGLGKKGKGRDGLDDNHGDLILVVHDPDVGANAEHYTPEGLIFKDDTVHFGDGNFQNVEGGKDKLPFSAAYDMVVHESAHGVTDHTSKLEYKYESGALNESFSDVMGAIAERWFPDSGRGDATHFLIGERITISGRGVRSMMDPTSPGVAEPGFESVSAIPRCTAPPDKVNDYCGVHTSSGIPNRAFSLMTVGGRHKTSKVVVASGLGWDESAKLWYNTFTHLTPQSTFHDAAMAQVSEVAKASPQHLQAVACAWHAVGVLTIGDKATEGVLRRVACTEKPSTCEGITEGYVCNSQADFAAIHCVNGAYKDAFMCPDISTQRCKPKAEDDPTASFDKDGHLVCE